MADHEILEKYQTQNLPMAQIYSDAEFNCRGSIAPIDVVDLARSINDEGLQQPIVVQPYRHPGKPDIKYRIVAGHRRHMAFRVNKQTHIPAMVRTDLDEMAARLFNLTENLKRLDLNILQEAKALLPFKNAGWAEDTIAARTGQSRGWIQVRVMLLKMPEEIQKEAAAGLLTQEQIRQLYSMKSDDQRFAAVRLIKERKEKGESTKLELKKPIKPHSKRERAFVDMIHLQDQIQEQVGNNIVTVVLGWCTGYVSDIELHRDLREWLAEQKKNYTIPREITEAL